MKLIDWPLRWTVPGSLLVFGLLVLVLLYFAELQSSYRRIESFESAQIRLLGTLTASEIEAALRRDDRASVQRSIERARGDRDLVRAALVDAKGMIRYSTHHADRGKPIGDSPFVHAESLIRETVNARTYGLRHDRHTERFFGTFPVLLLGASGDFRSSEIGALVTLHSLEMPLAFARTDARRRLAAAAVILALFSLLLWLFLRRTLLARINALAQATERIAGGDFETQIVIEGDDELSHLAGSLRTMARRLDESAKDLRRNERFYRSILENMEDIVSIVDADFRYEYVSPSTERISGYPPEWFVGKDAFISIPEEDAEENRRLLTDVLEGRIDQCELESRFIQADGTTAIYHTVCGLMESERERPRFLMASRNVTRLKQTEMALRESESRFNSLFDSLQDGAWAVSAADGEFLYGNRALERIYGRPIREFKTRPTLWVECAHPEDRALAESSMSRLDEQGFAEAEYRILRPDGELRWIHERKQLIYDTEGRVVRKGGLVTDVTEARLAAIERDRLENRLRQTQKMEAVGTLAGGVAHDFNNLLTAINGYADLLLDEMGENHGLAEEVREIRTAGERAAALTRQLLVFSRHDITQARSLDLNRIVQDLNRMLTRLIGEHIEYTSELHDAPLMLWADAGQIEQIIVNLVVNARDAMVRGGTLNIRTARVEFSKGDALGEERLAPGNYARLSVQDTGCGMSEAVLSRIFEPFFTTKEVGKGTGLGLATIYGIVKQCLGYITVDSTENKGTTFDVYLPLAGDKPPSEDRSDGGAKSLGGTETILFVEDERVVREIGSRILRGQGYRVLEAVGGEEALKLAQAEQERIHLLVTDMVMPNMAGRELATRLLDLFPEIRILLVSGYSEQLHAGEAPLPQDLPFLQKPYDPQTLATRVRDVLDGAPANRLL